MSSRKASHLDYEALEEMTDVIVALTRQMGDCARLDLIKAGFTARQIGDYYAIATALAALVLRRNPRNH